LSACSLEKETWGIKIPLAEVNSFPIKERSALGRLRGLPVKRLLEQ
jgi:hypothetical protein